jgi:hypothetical protein
MTDTIREQILAIRADGETSMFDARTVQRLAFEKGFYELVDFIESNSSAYARFILMGKAE